MPTPWTTNQAGKERAVVTMLMMGICTTGVVGVLRLVQHAQLETEWVVGWTLVLTTVLVTSMCSSQRMGNRLGGGGGETRKRKLGGGKMRRKGGDNFRLELNLSVMC